MGSPKAPGVIYYSRRKLYTVHLCDLLINRVPWDLSHESWKCNGSEDRKLPVYSNLERALQTSHSSSHTAAGTAPESDSSAATRQDVEFLMWNLDWRVQEG
jgi:hypothetical protein